MIDVKSLSFGYGKKSLFDNLSLSIGPGRICGLLGRNGAGKSTLLKLMAGTLKPGAGDVTVMGHPSFEKRVAMLENVMMVAEEFSLPAVSIERYATIYSNFYPRFSQQLFERLLGEFAVQRTADLNRMSFGQRKIAYLCFAISCQTDLLLLDEPTNGLDIPSKGIFRRVISSIATAERTVIISTHQVRDLDQLLDHVIILDNSKVLVDASVERITERLNFGRLEPGEESIYSEQAVYGTMGVRKNDTGIETPLDMELLFNAAISLPTQINNILR